MSKTLQDYFKKGKGGNCNLNIDDIFACYREQLMKLLEDNGISKPYPKIINEAIDESETYLNKSYDIVIKNYNTKRSKYFVDASNNEKFVYDKI